MIRKFILALPVLILLTACGRQSGSSSQITLLERQQAIEQWKQSQSTTDGCSSPWFISVWTIFLDKNWDDCCYQHDFDYGRGWQYGITREQADVELHDCVNASGHPVVANLMWLAVRTFGYSHYENP